MRPLFFLGLVIMDFEVKPAGGVLADGVVSPFPFVLAGGDAALAAMTEIRGRAHDLVPVLMGNLEEAARLLSDLDDRDGRDPSEIIAEASRGSADALFDAYETAQQEQLDAFYAARGKVAPVLVQDAPHGDWPEAVGGHQVPLSLFELGAHKPKSRVVIGLVPAKDPWEVPAHLKFGSWNDCPAADLHVALGREWHELFGARLIASLPDVLEYEVLSPIADREEALRVAEQQFRYCPDVVYHGHGTIEALAAALVGARYWFFWWD